MRQARHLLVLSTRGKGLYAFTQPLQDFVRSSGVREGLLTVFVQHTSASLLIQENADPEVRADLERFFSRLVPEDDPIYGHTTEGPDDMPAHVRAALTQSQLSLPVIDRAAALGTWQGVYLYEHRRAPQSRRVVLHLLGE